MTPHPLERALATGLRRLLMWAVPLTALGLLYPAPPPSDGLYGYVIVQLAIIQVATFLYAMEVGDLLDAPWFAGKRRAWLASTASLVASVVGFSALLTLSVSAAARYDVSLQFLQLLSSLDIAWVVSGLYLAGRVLWSRTIAATAATVLLIACVTSIAVYLSVVSFTDGGGWLVDGREMMRIVIPSDVMAAIITLSSLLIASRRRTQPTLQANDQS